MAYGNPNSKESNQQANNSDNSDVTGFGGGDDALAQLPESGDSPISRFKDAQSANSWAVDKFSADLWGSYDRSMVDEMCDNAPPMSQGDLRLNGQGNNFNINFGRAFAKEEQALAAYNDLASGDEFLITCECDYRKASPQQRDEYAQIYAKGFTRLHRYFWPDFVPNLQLLSKFFIRQGVAISFRRDPFDWRWSVGRLGDFQISRRDGCSVDDLECAVQRVYETPPEVMNWISNPEAARMAQWDVEAVKKAVRNATITVGQDSTNYNWEQVQRDAKDNGLFLSKGKDPRVELRHFWVKEFPTEDAESRISHYITSPSNNENFLCKRLGMWDTAADCMTFFTYGIGNGDFYSIRGLGYKIFALEQMFNILMSRLGDSTLRSTSYLWQPQSADSLEDSNQIIWGADAMIPQGIKPVETPTSNIGQNVLPILNMLSNIESINTGTYTASQQLLPGGRPDRKSATEASIEASQEAVLTSSAKTLFMQSLDRTYAMTSRALTRRDYPREMPGGPERWRLFRYCMDHGMPEEAFYNIECVRAVRPIGMGSPAAQQQKLAAMMPLLPFLDQQAQKLIIRKQVISNMGIDYGFLVNETPPNTADKKIAELESNSFINGITPEISDNEDDETHLDEHLGFIAQTLQSAEQGQMDHKDALTRLLAAIPHAKEHVARLEQNPINKEKAVKYIQGIQQMDAATQKLMQNLQQSQQAEQDAMEKEQQAQTAFQMEQARLDAELKAKIARDDAIAAADVQRKDQVAEAHTQIKQDVAGAGIEIGQTVAAHKILAEKTKSAVNVNNQIDKTNADVVSKAKVTKQKLVSDDLKTAQELEITAKKAKATDTSS